MKQLNLLGFDSATTMISQRLSISSQIATLDANIPRSMSDIKFAVRNEYIIARYQEHALLAVLASATGAMPVEQDQQIEYSALDREAQALRDQLQVLFNRYNQVSAATNIQSGTIVPLVSAIVPTLLYALNPIGAILVKYRADAAGEDYKHQYSYYQYAKRSEPS